MEKIWHFIKDYWLFASSLVGGIAALNLDIAGHDTAAHWILILLCAGGLIPLLWGMAQDLREGTYGVDILAATAIITALVMHEYWAALVIVLMLSGGEALEDYAEKRAKKELDALLSRAPQKAHIKRGNKVIDVAVAEVKAGDKVVIRPGEIVPVDAEITEGKASFDESSLTGESLPQIKKVGAQLLSGTVNLDGAIVATALHTAKDSQYEQIIRLVQSASKSKTPFVRMADRYAIPFTVIAFIIAGAAWAISGESIRFLEVLVVATPCPLILAAPIAVISGMSRSAKLGIIVKTGSALEKLAKVRTFAFDKTGTLTRGELTVDQVKAFSGFKAREVVSLAASLEQNSNHVLAKAIVEKALRTDKKLIKAKHIHELAGSGLRAQVGGKEVLVGRVGLLEEYKVDFATGFSPKDFQQTAAFVAVGGKLAGVITFKDEIRDETKRTLESLREQGVQDIIMVTGDSKHTARAIARKLGIKNFFAEALPADKIRAVEKAEKHPVAFVGDGVNDAPVLTASDLGIALGARGSTAASESADIVIMQDDLSHVAEARAISRRTFKIAKQSILVGIGLSVALMAVFATGKFKPIYGAAVQEVVDVVVIINALRAHSAGRKKSSRT